jgi:hypothetical protein
MVGMIEFDSRCCVYIASGTNALQKRTNSGAFEGHIGKEQNQ